MMLGSKTLEGEQSFGCSDETAAAGSTSGGCAENGMIEESFGSFPSCGGSEELLPYIIAAAMDLFLLDDRC